MKQVFIILYGEHYESHIGPAFEDEAKAHEYAEEFSKGETISFAEVVKREVE